MVSTQRNAIADTDDRERRQPARFACGEKAALDGGEQRFGHGVSAAGAGDHDRVAVLDELRGVVGGDSFHVYLVAESRQISSAYVAASRIAKPSRASASPSSTRRACSAAAGSVASHSTIHAATSNGRVLDSAVATKLAPGSAANR